MPDKKNPTSSKPTVAPTAAPSATNANFIVTIDLTKLESIATPQPTASDTAAKSALHGGKIDDSKLDAAAKLAKLGGKIIHKSRKGSTKGRGLQSEQDTALVVLSEDQIAKLKQQYGANVILGKPALDSVVKLDPIPPAVLQSTVTATGMATATDTPNYPWHFDRLSSFPSSGFVKVDPNAGSKQLVIVIDSGIRPGDEFIDSNGVSKILPGKSYIASEPDPGTDGLTHGTNMASIIAANSYSLTPSANVMSLKAFDSSGAGQASYILAALSDSIQIARDRRDAGLPAPIISMSLRFSYDENMKQQLMLILKELRELDVIVATAAGNDLANACNYLPSAMSRDFDNVVTIGAIGPKGDISDFSNFDPDPALGCIITFAPGEAIPGVISTVAGTSPATAVVAGLMADARARNPNFDYKQILDQIKTTGIVDSPATWQPEGIYSFPPRQYVAPASPWDADGYKEFKQPQGVLSDLIMTPNMPNPLGLGYAADRLFSPPQLRFKPISKSQDYVGLTFNVNAIDPNAAAPNLRLALLSNDLPSGFSDFRATPQEYKSSTFNARELLLSDITQNGDYWLKYYQENGKNMLAVGKGTEIGANQLKSYALDTVTTIDKITGSDPFTRFAFRSDPNIRLRLRSFAGSGNLAVPIQDTPIVRRTASPTMVTAAPTMDTSANLFKLQEVKPNFASYLSLSKGANGRNIAIDGKQYSVSLLQGGTGSTILIQEVTSESSKNTISTVKLTPGLGTLDKRLILKVVNGKDGINVFALNSQKAIDQGQPKTVKLFDAPKSAATIKVGYKKTEDTSASKAAIASKTAPANFRSGRLLEEGKSVELPESSFSQGAQKAAFLFSSAATSVATAAHGALQEISDMSEKSSEEWSSKQVAAAAALIALGAGTAAYMAYKKYTSNTETKLTSDQEVYDPEAISMKTIPANKIAEFEKDLVTPGTVQAMAASYDTSPKPKR